MVSTVSKPVTTTKPNAPQKPANASASGGFNIGSYFKGVKHEFKQISWPTKQQVILETVVVIIVVALFAVFIALSDAILSFIINLIN